MDHPDLEGKMEDIKKQKIEMVRELTQKSIDAINLSEQASLTHMTLQLKCPKKLQKKSMQEASQESG